MANPDSNDQLRTLFEGDQQFRRHAEAYNFTDQQWQDLAKADAERRQQVRAMLDSGQVKTVGDYWRAAVIMHHGHSIDDIQTALKCGVEALKLGQSPSSSLVPRTADRLALIAQEQQGIERSKMAQLFGTQFMTTSQGVIDFVYPATIQLSSRDTQLLAIFDLHHFTGQTVANYYQQRQQLALQMQTTWESMSTAEQADFVDRIIQTVNQGLLQYRLSAISDQP